MAFINEADFYNARGYRMVSGKILLISDDLETAQIWSYILNQKGIDSSLVTPSEDDSTERRPEYSHDLMIVDAVSPQMNVIQLIKRLRTESTIPILLLLPKEDERLFLEAYDIGADDVIAKPISARLFLAKVKAWMRRSWTVPASMLSSFQAGEFRLDPAQRQLVLQSGAVVRLTSLEFRLLHVLMSHPNQVLESSLLIDRVWGENSGGDNVLLKNVVYRLRRKIEPDPSQPRYIQSVTGEGYLFITLQSE
jgi:two-component system, OmpR family, response regulator RegX3